MKPKPAKKSQKKKFEIFISADENFLKEYKLLKTEIKNRLHWVLTLMCDFSTSVNIRFCMEEEMKATNFEFRGKAYATDVLSFPTNPKMEALLNQTTGEISESSLGDILVCVPVCVKQAKQARHSLSEELEKMLVHGIAHLKGFDHERGDEAWELMNSLEKNLRKFIERKFGKPVWCQLK